MKTTDKDNELIVASASKKEVVYTQKSGKRKKMEMSGEYTPGNWGSDYEKRKAEVNREANARVIKPISHEIFKKTKDEREALKMMQVIHKNAIKAQGFDPKKEMNPRGNLFTE